MRTHERDGSELGADDSFGSGDGQDDRLERADVIDPDGVEQHGDRDERDGRNRRKCAERSQFR